MKNKKSIYFLIFAIIIFIVMLLFFIYVQFFEETKNSFEKVEKQEIEVMNKMREENIEEENKSITKDFEANYMDFMVFDKSGNSIRLSDYKDSPIMIVFLDDNEESKEFFKNINEVYDNYKNIINFILITVGENEIENRNIPVYFDKEKEVVKEYNITEFPVMICLNRQNEIFNSKVGCPSKDALEANLDILSENY